MTNGGEPPRGGQPWQSHPGQAPGGPYESAPGGSAPHPGRFSGEAPPYPPAPEPWGPSYPAAGDPTDVVGRRVAQYLLDSVIVFVGGIVVFGVIIGGAASSVDPNSGVFPGMIGLAYLLVAVWSWFVFAGLASRLGGQTIGMRALGLRVVTLTGERPSLGALTVRWLLLLVDGFFCGVVGLIVMAASNRHQRLGDMAAGTLVVRA